MRPRRAGPPGPRVSTASRGWIFTTLSSRVRESWELRTGARNIYDLSALAVVPWKDPNAPQVFRVVRPNVAPEQRGRLAEAWAGRPVDRFYDALSRLKPQATLEWPARPHHEAPVSVGPAAP